MSSFDKTVKLACKPKAAAPKAKYLDPIIAATFADEGAIHDVCKALSPRFREPNTVVVFKALIVLHTMMRNGATDNVLQYLSTSDVLRLRNVSTGQWEGYNTPENLQNYAVYLDSRIRTYKDLKHDPVRVQSEVNRDMRLENSIEEDRARSRGGPQRSKTIAGRKLRVMSVEKGLLRETKAVQKTITALLECKFYADDLEQELTITALRMLVKDMLVLFQAVNEGVINVLEHYFEMSHIDAEQALVVYRNFCTQTESVVEYFMIAKKLENLLHVPIPNLKHAPVSLLGSLEEYLQDPNFEQNRLEYKQNKAAADKSVRSSSKSTPKPILKSSPKAEASSLSKPASSSTKPATQTSTSKPETNQALVDFFSAIEEEQPNMFNPQTGSPNANYFQQQAAHNPFQRQVPMVTGAFGQPSFGIPQQPQATGFLQPQQTAFPGAFPQSSPFPQQQQQQQHQPFSAFMQPQPTGFLQPQPTGSNPFRQSMAMAPQITGFPAFGAGAGAPAATPFQTSGPSFQVPSFSNQSQSAQSPNFALPPNSGRANVQTTQSTPLRPASTPITTNPSSSFGQSMQPVVTHQTGTRNPFGVPQAAPPPPVPKPPTLQELALGAFGGNATPQQQQTTAGGVNGTSAYQAVGGRPSSPPGGGNMSSIASSFTFNSDWKPISSQSSPTTTSVAGQTTPSNLSDSFTSFSSQATGSTNGTSVPAASPIQPQMTGFSGMKAFKPTSSFGASLLESLPPIPQSTPSNTSNANNGPNSTPASSNAISNTPSFSSASSNSTGSGAFGQQAGFPNVNVSLHSQTPLSNLSNSNATGFGALNSQATGAGSMGGFGSNLGGGLRPQMTGSGVANPFRMSMLNPASGGSGGSPFNPSFGAATGQASKPIFPSATGAPQSFGATLFQHGGFGTNNSTALGSDTSKQQQQNGVASLI